MINNNGGGNPNHAADGKFTSAANKGAGIKAKSPLEKLMGGLMQGANKDLEKENKVVNAIKKMGFAGEEEDLEKRIRDNAEKKRQQFHPNAKINNPKMSEDKKFIDYDLDVDGTGQNQKRRLDLEQGIDHDISTWDSIKKGEINLNPIKKMGFDNPAKNKLANMEVGSMKLTGDNDDEEVIIDKKPDGTYVLSSASGNHINGADPDNTYESKPMSLDELMEELENNGYDKYLED